MDATASGEMQHRKMGEETVNVETVKAVGPHLQRDLLGCVEGDQEAGDGQEGVVLAAAAVALEVVPPEGQQLLAVLLQQRRRGADQAARQLQQPRL